MSEYKLGENLSRKEYFLSACMASDLQGWYKEYINQKPSRLQEFNELPNGILTHHYWCPSNICRHSKEVITDINDLDVFIGYWTPQCWFPVKKEYKKIGMQLEAYECQLIDCNCNDCAFFDRSTSKCNKFDKTVSPKPNTCQPDTQECFLHRKDLNTKAPK